MAKREFIEKEMAINIATKARLVGDCRKMKTIFSDSNYCTEYPIVIEQDIVKPYLDKLELQIARKYGNTATGDVANVCKDIVKRR